MNDKAAHFADVTAALNSLSYSNGEIEININGERVYPDSAPFIIEGRTMVPIRAIAEKMGYTVEWDGEDQIIFLTSPDSSTVIGLGIGIDVMIKNHSEIALEVAPVIVNERTYLPLRAVTEAMDATVSWNGETRTVDITK